MTAEEKIRLYRSVFKGREDIYAKIWEKNGRSGYSPAYDLNWDEFFAYRSKGGTMSDFENKTLLPLSDEVIRKHLTGKWTLGIYPILHDNSSYFIAADFDKKEWKEDSKSLIEQCKKHDIPVYLERSRSGNGAHVWVFFQEAYPAYKSRKIMLELIRKALDFSDFEREVSFDRLFPSQDYLSKNGFGNLIAFPLNGNRVKQGNSCFIDPESFEAYPNQWEILESIKKISTPMLDELYALFTDSSSITMNLATSNKLQIIIKNQIYLQKEHLNSELIIFLRESLNFSNSAYFLRKKMGKNVHNVEKYFNTIGETDREIMIPRGFMNQLVEFCEDCGIEFEIKDQRELLSAIELKKSIELYDYQKEALEYFQDKDYGVLVAPPGAGKTVMGLELISRKKQPALIVVHRKQLMEQWVERIQSFLGIPKKDIGIIRGAKKKTGKQITIAMVQSLVKMGNAKELSHQFGTIIIDECHHIPAKTFRKAILSFNSYYLYGLTATPKRKHNDEKLIFVYIGDIIARADSKKNRELLKDHQFEINIRNTSLNLPFDYAIDNFQVLSKVTIYDSGRNRMIVEDIKKEVAKGKKILVLTERKGHVNVLDLYLKSQIEVITISGDDSAKAQKLKLEQVQLGHFQILITTGQFFGEGMDIQNLNCLFLVYPFSFEGKLTQYIGRIERSEGHKTLYDYRDIEIPYYENLYRKRQRYYNRLKRQDENVVIVKD